ncbi:hypothetical protein HB780_05450 (plasmid) [Rhizobium lusitanum]|uniref:hypothetical protein n=1 Tax=Rhizobium lusitanum TaxID=293958 RepID=UPI001611219B|nr:hypothetical protein [Rhizobium lusitanum]QND45201.1 hypothetical protein HB780_05450 [Rhizobium lusitanum]
MTEHPSSGGRYYRDPKTGVLTKDEVATELPDSGAVSVKSVSGLTPIGGGEPVDPPIDIVTETLTETPAAPAGADNPKKGK